MYEKTLTGRPHDTGVQKATSDNENVDAAYRHTLDITRCSWLKAGRHAAILTNQKTTEKTVSHKSKLYGITNSV